MTKIIIAHNTAKVKVKTNKLGSCPANIAKNTSNVFSKILILKLK